MKHNKLAALALLSSLLLTACGSKAYASKDYILSLPWKDDFKIIQLSDIHLANKDDQDKQFDFLRSTINHANSTGKADLIVTTGDLFTFADKATARRLFSFFDSFEIPWTVTWGNHDEQCYFSIDWVTGLLNDLTNSGNSYCVFKDIQDDEVFGNANFAINLVENGVAHTQVIIMDSNRYNFGEYIGYDYIKQNQIDWYKNLTDYSKVNNEYVTSLLFFHIPLPEFADAWKLHEQDPVNYPLLFEGGVNDEACSCPLINSGFFDVLKTHGSKGVFVGHDHIDNWAMVYQGVTLSYGVTSTDRIYAEKDMMYRTLNKRIDKHIPDCQPLMIEDATHTSTFESTETVINPALIEFFG